MEEFTLKTISHGSKEISMYGHIGGILRYDHVLHALEKYSSQEKNFLDIGCGEGAYIIETSKLFNRSLGLDISPANINFCKERLQRFKLKNCIFLLGNATKLPFSNEKFSVILISEVLEHLPPSQISHVLEEAKRVLCQNGVLLITVPSIFLDYKANKECLFKNIILSFKKVVPNKKNILEGRTERKRGTFHNFFTKKEIEHIVSSKRIEVLKLQYIVKFPCARYFVPSPIRRIVKSILHISSSDCLNMCNQLSKITSLPDLNKITKFHKVFEFLPFFGNQILISAVKK